MPEDEPPNQERASSKDSLKSRGNKGKLKRSSSRTKIRSAKGTEEKAEEPTSPVSPVSPSTEETDFQSDGNVQSDGNDVTNETTSLQTSQDAENKNFTSQGSTQAESAELAERSSSMSRRKEVRFNDVVTAVRKSNSFTLGTSVRSKARAAAMNMSFDDLKPILAPSSPSSPGTSKDKSRRSFKSASMEDGLNDHLKKNSAFTASLEDYSGSAPKAGSSQERRMLDRASRRAMLSAQLKEGQADRATPATSTKEKQGTEVVGCCSLRSLWELATDPV